MTPEAFEAKWGEALRAAGIACEIDGPILWLDDMPVGSTPNENTEAEARGLLVAWAAERRAAVETYCDDENEKHPVEWCFQQHGEYLSFATDDFDAALIPGCIALAKHEADQ